MTVVKVVLLVGLMLLTVCMVISTVRDIKVKIAKNKEDKKVEKK